MSEGTVRERSIRVEIYFGFAVGEREVYQKSEIYYGENEVSQEYNTRERGLPESGLYSGFVAGRTSVCSNANAPLRMVWAPSALFGIGDQYFPEGMCIMWYWP